MILTKPLQVHFRLSTTLPSRVHYHEIKPDHHSVWNPVVRPGSIPYAVLEEIKKYGEVDNEQLQFISERKNINVALYSLRKKGLIVGVGEHPFTKHKLA
jgi:hypothetical protein